MGNIKYLVSRLSYSLQNFKNAPIDNLGFLIPAAMVAVSMVAALIGYILFVVQGGYPEQLSVLQKLGAGGFFQGFTYGSVGVSLSGPVAVFIAVLFFAQMAVMLVSYFKTARKAKRITMIVDLVILAIVTVLLVAMASSATFSNSVRLAEGELQSTVPSLGALSAPSGIIPLSLSVILLVVVAVFIVLAATSECKRMLVNGLIGLGVSFIACPLVVLFLENIIQLGIVAALFAVAFIVFKIMTGSGEESSSAGVSSSSSSSATGSFSPSENKPKRNSETEYYVDDFNEPLGIKLFKRKGFLENIIEVDNGMVARTVCSLEDFEKGRFHIYEKKSGREITDSEIHWRQ